jgi:hypothetical protein
MGCAQGGASKAKQGKPSLAPQPKPKCGYLLVEANAKSQSSLSMPLWERSYDKGAQRMLAVAMKGSDVAMQVSNPLRRRIPHFNKWAFDKVKSHTTLVQDSSGKDVAFIIPQAPDPDSMYRGGDVREVIYCTRPFFDGQLPVKIKNGSGKAVEVFSWARVESDWSTANPIPSRYQLHMAEGKHFQNEASADFAPPGQFGTGDGQTIGFVKNSKQAKASEYTFASGVDACLMILFSIAALKAQIDMEEIWGGEGVMCSRPSTPMHGA